MMGICMVSKSVLKMATISLVVLAAGCGSSAGGSGDAANNRDVSSSALDGLSSDRAFLRTSEDILISKCMQAKGFEYNPLRFTASQVEADVLVDKKGPGAGADVVKASRQGYGLYNAVPNDTSRLPKNPNSHVDSMSQTEQRRWHDALSGEADVTVEIPDGMTMHVSSKGCKAEARRSLYGDFVKWTTTEALVRNRFVKVQAWVRADPGLESSVARWSECMNKKGYRYKTPEDATRYAADAFMSKPSMKRKEIELAVADAECNRDAGLEKTYQELTEKHTRKWVSQNETRVLAVQEMRKRALSRAKTLVG